MSLQGRGNEELSALHHRRMTLMINTDLLLFQV
jgi:hypothetical protein